MGKVFLFGLLILTNNWGFRTNILDISLDRNFLYIHGIVMGIRSVSRGTLIRIVGLCMHFGTYAFKFYSWCQLSIMDIYILDFNVLELYKNWNSKNSVTNGTFLQSSFDTDVCHQIELNSS